MDESDYRALVESRWNPLIEDGHATFVWFGDRAPQLMGDFTAWEQRPVKLKKAAPGVWTASVEFPPDTYMEYAFLDGKERAGDPYNPHLTPDGFGHLNHYFYMPEAAPTPLANPTARRPHGEVTRVTLPCGWFLTGRTRAVWFYSPPVDEAVPLWVVYDGQDYLNRARLPAILDNLIADGEIRPVALAMVRNGGQAARGIEYGCSDMTIGFLMETLLPYAREHLNLLDVKDHPGAYGVLGASMGGLMALYTGMRAPGVFGHVLSQSGAFDFGGYQPVVNELVRCLPKQDLKIFMDAGRYEWLLEANRSMRDLLQQRGYAPGYREFSAGHNYPAWRDDLPNGLRFLLANSFS